MVTNFLNMGIHRKYVSYYSHSSFFMVTNFEIWVYIENICLIIHIVPFYGYKFLKYGCTRKWKFIFYLLLKSCPRSIFWNFRICPRWLHFTLLIENFFVNYEWIKTNNLYLLFFLLCVVRQISMISIICHCFPLSTISFLAQMLEK